MWGSAGLWRAVAAAVVAAVVLGRPAPEVEAPELVATVSPTVGDVQLVALNRPRGGLIRFTRLAGEAPARTARSTLAAAGGATTPASLRVLGGARFSVPVPAAFAGQVGPGTAILSSEQAGGSPTGQPRGRRPGPGRGQRALTA